MTMLVGEFETSLETARAAYESAITAVGQHVALGGAIWEGYRVLEMGILDALTVQVNLCAFMELWSRMFSPSFVFLFFIFVLFFISVLVFCPNAL